MTTDRTQPDGPFPGAVDEIVDASTVRWSGGAPDPEGTTGLWLAPGTVVDHFRVLRLLGRGGMGEVFLARDLRLGRRVALKFLRARDIGSQSSVERFLHEARTTALFAHPNIVAVHFAGELDGNPYLAMEYLEGQTLRQRMAEGRMGVREAARHALAIADALAEAHRHGILHRDLKPDNVMIGSDGRLRVLDFGLAKRVEHEVTSENLETDTDALAGLSSELTQHGELRGTPAYMAPEQWGTDEITAAADLWSLGLLMHEMVAGRHPYANLAAPVLAARVVMPDPVPTAFGDGVPAELVELNECCLAKDPLQRPRASELVEVLERVVDMPVRRGGGTRIPFPGLVAQRERDAAGFFGRETEIHAFVELMRREAVLPVVGPSGGGKSSFVQAGVVPRLREQGRWVVIGLRPGRRPLRALTGRLQAREGWQTTGPRTTAGSGGLGEPAAEVPVSSEDGDTLLAELRRSPTRLALKLEAIAEQERARVLLFVDQLEELYTLDCDPADRTTFMEAISTAADDPQGAVRVVFTLRDDFLGRVAEARAARDVLGQVTVLRSPDPDRLREILVRPVEAVGYGFDDPRLVDEMVAALKGEPSALPLVQVAGMALWAGRDRQHRLLLRATYEATGGIAGALAHHADGVLDGLSASQVRTAREVLLRLVTADGTRQVAGRDEVVGGLGDGAAEVLDRLVQGRLVTVRRSQGESDAGTQVELVHESLIRGWQRLSRWLEAGREEMAFLAEVGQAAELWERRGRRPEEVWHGDALREARASLRRCSGDVPARVTQFIEAGDVEHRRALRRRRRFTALGIAALALFALASTWVAFDRADKQRETDRQRVIAEHGRAAAQLGGARAAITGGDPLRARALLRGSFEIRDTPEARALWRDLSHEPMEWRRHLGTAPNVVVASPDGSVIAAACQNRSIYLMDPATSEVTQVLRGEQDQVYWLRFSADGRRLGGHDWAGRLVTWDVGDRWTQTLWEAPRFLSIAALEPGGTFFAASDLDGELLVIPATPGGELRVVGRWERSLRDLDFSPDGRLLLATDRTAALPVWNLGTGELLHLLQGHEQRITDAAFSPDGRRIATAGKDNTVRLWDVGAGACERVVPTGTWVPTKVAYSPDGQQLVVGASSGEVMLLELEGEGDPIRLGRHDDTIYSVAFVPGEPAVLTSSHDNTVRRWDTTVRPRPVQERGHLGAVRAVAISTDGRLLASGGNDTTVRLWDAVDGRQLARLEGHERMVTRVAFSPDGELLASASNDRTVRIWNVANRELVATITGHGGVVEGLAFRPDGRQLASGAWDGTIRLWAREGWRLERKIEGVDRCPYDLEYSGDGRLLASITPGGETAIWDPARGTLVRRIEPGCPSAWGLALDPAGQQLVCALEHGEVQVWDLASGRRTARHELPARSYGIDLHPDGRHVAVPCSDAVVRVLDLVDGSMLEIAGHHDEVAAVRFSADGETLVSGADDGTVRLWRAADGTPAWTAEAGQMRAEIVAGGRRVRGFADGSVEVDAVTGGGESGARFLQDVPSHRVVQLLEGPRDSVVVGYASGHLGLWDLRTGVPLASWHLHGPVVRLALDGDHLEAVTELGDRLRADLSAFTRERCDLMREVWQAVPVQWDEGAPVRAVPPAGHECVHNDP